VSDNVVILSNEKHSDMKIDTRPGAKYGDHVNRTLAFSTEFDELHKEFPILFHKEPKTGAYQSHVILGFDKDENLFVGEHGWLSDYVPAVLARGPFMIGVQERAPDGELRREPVILVDMDNPRVGFADGESVFLPQGGNTPYLERVMRTLQVIHQGTIFEKTFFSYLESMDLIEPVSIKLTLSNIEQVNLHSYHTINAERLAGLDGASLERLNKMGVLRLAFFALSSLGNLQKLIELKNKKAALG
jgi:hypothetical protein